MEKLLPELKFSLRSLFTFSDREKRGLLWLMPLLAAVGLLVFFASRPPFEKTFLDFETVASESVAGGSVRPDESASPASGGSVRSGADGFSAPHEGDSAGLFAFDPNTATLADMCRLGLTAKTAAGIVKYRERGKRFEIPEDFATCYGVTLEDYLRLEPYIEIGDEFRLRPVARGGSFSGAAGSGTGAPVASRAAQPELTAFDLNLYDVADFVRIGFSERQAAVIVRYRESIGGFRTVEEFGKCYVVSDEKLRQLAPYIVIGVPSSESPHDIGESDASSVDGMTPEGLVDLNKADSATLRSVSGIGDVLVVRIIEYRRRLGGFASVEQLAEITGMTEANYERIREQIYVDPIAIQKIDVNFATHKKLTETLGNHPYVTSKILRKLLKERQLKGGWSSIEDMVSQNIMTESEARKLAPYLDFQQ